MSNQEKDAIIHLFQEINIGKFKGVKHYELLEIMNGKPQLSQLINISKDRNCARSKPAYWLKIRLLNKWSDPVTGLFKTSINGYTYSGDFKNKSHFVLFQFSRDATKLKVYVYLNYFPFDKTLCPTTVANRIKSIPLTSN